jgi:sn-glycerol 3-phosphate transport system permease protein
MSPIIPLIITTLAAGLGAVLLALTFRRMKRNAGTGALIGAVGGAVGSLLFMVPLNYCTFEPERRPIDNAIGVFMVVIGVALVLTVINWAAQQSRGGIAGLFATEALPGSFKGWVWPLILLAPTIIILLGFLYYPSLNTIWLSTQSSILGIPGTIPVCVDNFATMFTDPTYVRVLGNTLFITIFTVVLSMALGLLIALGAYQSIKGARIYRTLLIWPYAVSPVVAGIIFLLLFNPTGGIINYALGLFGIDGVRWLNSPQAAPWTIIIASVWKSLGFNILFYIAGLQNVPNDLKEAASIDGANVFQRFRRIVIPLLSPITFFLLITNTTYAIFETVGTIQYLTPGGGPLQSTETMMYRIYQVGVSNLGGSSAQSIILFLIVIGLTVFQFRTGDKNVNYGA